MPDPEQIILGVLEAISVPVPALSDILAPPEAPIAHAPEPPEDPVVPEAGPSVANDGGSDYFYDDWGGSVGDRY